ncbi:MAG: glycosyltransferase [Candidatus Aminicenantes bacterium]|nr:glycosyltransferase [Candidatus Aminicenantes bacterium]
MKIAYIVDHDIDITNGVSFQSKQFLTWLADNNHEIHLIFPSKRKKKNLSYGEHIHCYPVPAFSVPSYKEYCVPLPPLAASLWLKKWDIDLIHAETINPVLLQMGYWIKFRTKAPMFNVLTANIPYYSHLLFPKENLVKKICFWYGRALMKRISNKIEGTFILSEGVRKSLTQDFYSIDQKKVCAIKRPIDLQRFSNGACESGIFNRFDVPKGNRLVTLSRLCPTKNVDFLIRAFATYIYPKNSRLHFFIGGYGPLSGLLKKTVAGLNCPNIHFLGKIDFESVPGFFKEADYFLYGSLSETFGNVICEAKFSKLPVIALDDKAGVSSQIENYMTGILVENQVEKDFAAKFFELYNNPELQEKIRHNAHWDVCLNNNPQKIYSNLLSVYKKFMQNGHATREELNTLFPITQTCRDEWEPPVFVMTSSQRERMYD